jgi:hypothetical protein
MENGLMHVQHHLHDIIYVSKGIQTHVIWQGLEQHSQKLTLFGTQIWHFSTDTNLKLVPVYSPWKVPQYDTETWKCFDPEASS